MRKRYYLNLSLIQCPITHRAMPAKSNYLTHNVSSFKANKVWFISNSESHLLRFMRNLILVTQGPSSPSPSSLGDLCEPEVRSRGLPVWDGELCLSVSGYSMSLIAATWHHWSETHRVCPYFLYSLTAPDYYQKHLDIVIRTSFLEMRRARALGMLLLLLSRFSRVWLCATP